MSFARFIALVVLSIFVPATLTTAQKPEGGTNIKPEEQVKQLERDWLAADATGDSISIRRIIADDFIGSSFDGGVLYKDDIVPQQPGPGGFAGATTGETIVRVFGDTAVLMGFINTAGGGQSNRIRVTLVCQKRAQGWQMIAVQLAALNPQIKTTSTRVEHPS